MMSTVDWFAPSRRLVDHKVKLIPVGQSSAPISWNCRKTRKTAITPVETVTLRPIPGHMRPNLNDGEAEDQVALQAVILRRTPRRDKLLRRGD